MQQRTKTTVYIVSVYVPGPLQPEHYWQGSSVTEFALKLDEMLERYPEYSVRADRHDYWGPDEHKATTNLTAAPPNPHSDLPAL